MDNPFEIIEQRLSNIETLLLDIKHGEHSLNEVELLTRNEVAKMLKISLVTLNEWTNKGKIPTLRIGTQIRFKKDEVLNSLKEVNTLK